MPEDTASNLAAAANHLRRHDGKLLHGSLTFKMCVLNRDWKAVAALAPEQRHAMHDTSLLDADDWAYICAEAAKDGYTL